MDASDAWAAAEEIGGPVVVKPRYGNQGRGVSVNLSTREEVERAWHVAREQDAAVVVERFVSGDDYRLLVVGGAVVAAARRHPPTVRADGSSTVQELIDRVNEDPRRCGDHATSLSPVVIDEVAMAVLAEQGLSPESVPCLDRIVLLRQNANLSTGGTSEDVTDHVHPDVASRAVEAARIIGLDIAGIDVVTTDIRHPLETQRGVVVEVNAGPGLRMHLELRSSIRCLLLLTMAGFPWLPLRVPTGKQPSCGCLPIWRPPVVRLWGRHAQREFGLVHDRLREVIAVAL